MIQRQFEQTIATYATSNVNNLNISLTVNTKIDFTKWAVFTSEDTKSLLAIKSKSVLIQSQSISIIVSLFS